MLDILLFLLKLIGFLLLGMIGLVVAMLLAALLVPVRYRIIASHGNQTSIEGTFTWLLHALRVRFTRKEEKQRIWIRIFGFTIYDSAKPKKAKKEKDKSGKKKKNKNSDKSKKKPSKKKKKVSKKAKKKNSKKTSNNINQSHKTENKVTDKSSNLRSNEKEVSTSSTTSKELVKDRSINTQGKVIEEAVNANNNEDSEGWFSKQISKIKNWYQNLKQKLSDWYQKLIQMKDRLSKIRDFLDMEDNKLALTAGYGSLRKIIGHLKPTKMESRIRFGTGDPCTTGLGLGLAGILYGIYGDNIKITPDFEEKVFEGYHSLRGRIRIGTLLIIVSRLVLGKDFKTLKDNFKTLKEAL